MDPSLIESYGYWAVLLGGIVEGEAVFIAAGYAVSQDLLLPVPVYLVAVAGGTLGDFGYFLLGRVFGPRLLARFRPLRKLQARASGILRHRVPAAAFLTRFAYGLRVVVPMSLGAAHRPVLVFLLFNLLASFLFAAIYLSAGYLFGEALEGFLGRVHQYQSDILVGVVAAGLLAWALREWTLLHGPDERDRDDGEDRDA